MADFPVPVGPTNSRGISWVMYVSKKKRCRHVSTVGMIRSLTWGKREGERKERRKERGGMLNVYMQVTLGPDEEYTA